jgi:hypothetical protein
MIVMIAMIALKYSLKKRTFSHRQIAAGAERTLVSIPPIAVRMLPLVEKEESVSQPAHHSQQHAMNTPPVIPCTI